MSTVLKEDSDRRRRVRNLCASPLFDFFIDWEPPEEDFLAIGITAREVGYTPEDVKAIYWQEVVPAVMGTWGRMDPSSSDWLGKRIRERPRIAYWLTWVIWPWWGFTVCDYWKRICKGL
jgi:hypothetical protein